jgi:hypothetical protein
MREEKLVESMSAQTRARDASDDTPPERLPPALRPRGGRRPRTRRDPPLGTVTMLDLGFEPDSYCNIRILNNLPSGGILFAEYGDDTTTGVKLYRLDPDGSLAVLFETNAINDAVVDPKGRGYFVAAAQTLEVILVGHNGEVLRRVQIEEYTYAFAATSDSFYFISYNHSSELSNFMDIGAMVFDSDSLDRTRRICKYAVSGACYGTGFDANESSLIVANEHAGKTQIIRVSTSTQEVSLIVECLDPTDLAVASDGIIYVICNSPGTPRELDLDDDISDLRVHQVVKTDHGYAMTRMDVNLKDCESLALDERRGLLYVASQWRLHTIAVPTYAERREQLIWPIFRLFALASLGHARLAAPLPPLYRTEAVYRRLVRLPRCLFHRVLCYAVPNFSF